MSTTLLSAGPKLLVSRAVTTDSPTNPTPTSKPLFSAFPVLMPMQMPNMVNMTGIMTAAPNPMI